MADNDTVGRLQRLEVALNETRDDAMESVANQSHGGSELLGDLGGWKHAWDFPGGGGDSPTTHQPFELRVRVEPDGAAHWLDIYDPQGAYTRFLDSATQIRNTYPAVRSASHPLTDVGGGWYAVANLDAAAFVNGKATLYVVFANMNGDTFRLEFTSNNVTESGRIAVGIVTRTVGETTTYAIQQIVLGAFFADYVWDGAEAVMTQKDGEWTADLSGVAWTPTTPLILARLYSRTLVFAARPQGPIMLAHPCAEIPLGEQDTLPCFAAKIDATPHAADHIQDFIPFAEEENA